MPHAYSDDALTLARLLQEPALRRARIHAGRARRRHPVEWVRRSVRRGPAGRSAQGSLVHAHAEEPAASTSR